MAAAAARCRGDGDRHHARTRISGEARCRAGSARRRQPGRRSMSDPQVAMLMMGLLLFAIMIGFPIAFTLLAMGVFFGYYAYGVPDQIGLLDNRVFDLLVQNTFSIMSNDVLTAVPLFLFMGYIIEISKHQNRKSVVSGKRG